MSKSVSGSVSGDNLRASKGSTEIRPKNMIKTVFLPNEQINNLGIELDILKNQLETDKRFYEQEITFLDEEKQRRQNEFWTKSQSDKEKIE